MLGAPADSRKAFAIRRKHTSTRQIVEKVQLVQRRQRLLMKFHDFEQGIDAVVDFIECLPKFRLPNLNQFNEFNFRFRAGDDVFDICLTTV